VVVNSTKEKLIQDLVRGGYLKTPIIIEAFQNIDRKDFVPSNIGNEAYVNEPLPIGYGQTISQPLTVAFILELLDPREGELILDIGSGSGWQAALLAYCVGGVDVKRGILGTEFQKKPSAKHGKVVAVERISELAEMTKENLGKYGFFESGVVEVVLGDGAREPVGKGPFDKIVAAASAEEIPKFWKENLKAGGRIVAPVGHSIFEIRKLSESKFETREHFGFSFVPLVEG
jgi:protein-L-isoaspartate(D-aspartate) O-methyltransferase